MPDIAGSEKEKDWQAECDAQTIADAEGIKSDSARFERAQKAAKRMMEEQKARAEALERLAKATPDKWFDKTKPEDMKSNSGG
jgi:hypothetical protein